jgi:hypothetical protein
MMSEGNTVLRATAALLRLLWPRYLPRRFDHDVRKRCGGAAPGVLGFAKLRAA